MALSLSLLTDLQRLYYEPVIVTIDAPGLAQVVIDIVVRHHNLSNSNFSNCNSVFISKF